MLEAGFKTGHGKAVTEFIIYKFGLMKRPITT